MCIVTVFVVGGGYDFEAAKKFLLALNDELDVVNPGSKELVTTFLEQHGEGFENLQSLLSATLPNVIAISLQPEGTPNHWRAVVQDVLDKIANQQASFKLRTAPRRRGRTVPFLKLEEPDMATQAQRNDGGLQLHSLAAGRTGIKVNTNNMHGT